MKTNRKKGFTLVELLVVISIIGMLTALLLPAVQAAREAGRRATCISNQRNLGLAMHNYESSKGSLPGVINHIYTAKTTPPTSYFGSWVAVLFPYLEKMDVWDELRLGNHIDSVNPDGAAAAKLIRDNTVKILACPSNPGADANSSQNLCHRVNCGRSGMIDSSQNIDSQYCGVFDLNGVTLDSVRDGTSSTLMLGEAIFPSSWSEGLDYGLTGGYNLTTPSSNTGHQIIKGTNDLEKKLGFVVPQTQDLTSEPPVDLKVNLDLDVNATTDSGNIGSQHPGVIVVTFCDGHSQTLADGIDEGVYLHLITPNSKKARALGKDKNWQYFNVTSGKFYNILDENDF